jgi:PBP1b-binding outer membrane lipoprotein LpoB
MNLRRLMIVTLALLLILGLMLGGCQKKEEPKVEEQPAATEQPATTDTTMAVDTTHAEHPAPQQ